MTRPFLEYNWLESNCIGPPSAIEFFLSDSDSDNLDTINTVDSFDSCGLLRIGIDQNQCCYVGLDDSLAMTAWAGNYNLDNGWQMPSSANGHQYCNLGSKMVLRDGSCNDNVMCDSDLHIFDSSGCFGNVETFAINDTSVIIASDILGRISVSTTIVTNGTLNYRWIDDFPIGNYQSNFQNPFAALGETARYSAILISLICALFYFWKYRTGTKVHLILMGCHLLWLSYGIVDAIMLSSPALADSTYNLILVLDWWTYDLSLLYFTLLNEYIYMSLVLQPSRIIEWLAYGMTVAVHIGLCGRDYIDPFISISNIHLQGDDWTNTTDLIWTILMFGVGIVTSLGVTVHILKSDPFYRLETNVNTVVRAFRNPKILVVFLCQLIAAVSFTVCYFAQNYTLWLGRDINWIECDGIMNFLLTIHALLSSFSYEYFSVILIEVSTLRHKKGRKRDNTNSTVIDKHQLRHSKLISENSFKETESYDVLNDMIESHILESHILECPKNSPVQISEPSWYP